MQRRVQHSQIRVQKTQQEGRTIGKEIEVTLELLLVACMHTDELSAKQLWLGQEMNKELGFMHIAMDKYGQILAVGACAKDQRKNCCSTGSLPRAARRA